MYKSLLNILQNQFFNDTRKHIEKVTILDNGHLRSLTMIMTRQSAIIKVCRFVFRYLVSIQSSMFIWTSTWIIAMMIIIITSLSELLWTLNDQPMVPLPIISSKVYNCPRLVSSFNVMLE